jgi:hypothetical protein
MIDHHVQWTVVGAGPAGIAAMGQLTEARIAADQIAWIDPVFNAGDFGTAWKRVTSNTPVSSFIKFYNAFDTFNFKQAHTPFMVERLGPESSCPLMLAAQPLKWITEQLRNQAVSVCETVLGLRHTSQGWLLQCTNDRKLLSQKVILALGAEAIELPYPQLTTIPLVTAADVSKLDAAIGAEDVLAVFGSYQSARTVEENLAKTRAKKIIHFYRSERSFEQHVASLGLSEHVETWPATPINLLTHIPRCNKAIYAVGFTRRAMRIDGLPEDFSYNSETGQIAPGLYGLGIAFPEIIPYTMGRVAYKVSAIWPFIKYLKKIFPLWMNEETVQQQFTQQERSIDQHTMIPENA